MAVPKKRRRRVSRRKTRSALRRCSKCGRKVRDLYAHQWKLHRTRGMWSPGGLKKRRRQIHRIQTQWKAKVKKYGSEQGAREAEKRDFARWTADWNREADANAAKWGWSTSGEHAKRSEPRPAARHNVDAHTVSRIQKLRRLSRSPNVHEAALARQRAAEMMAQHGISESDL